MRIPPFYQKKKSLSESEDGQTLKRSSGCSDQEFLDRPQQLLLHGEGCTPPSQSQGLPLHLPDSCQEARLHSLPRGLHKALSTVPHTLYLTALHSLPGIRLPLSSHACPPRAPGLLLPLPERLAGSRLLLPVSWSPNHSTFTV